MSYRYWYLVYTYMEKYGPACQSLAIASPFSSDFDLATISRTLYQKHKQACIVTLWKEINEYQYRSFSAFCTQVDNALNPPKKKQNVFKLIHGEKKDDDPQTSA